MKRFLPMTRLAVFGAAWLLLCGASLDTYRAVDRGNDALAAGDAAAAVDAYEQALANTPDDPALVYNLGTAKLAAGDAEAASGLLSDALSLAGSGAGSGAEALEDVDPALAGRGAFNLGNALMARAEGNQGDPEQAAAALKNAVRAYRQAVAADPADVDARRNLQLAATALRDLSRQQSEQQKQDGKNKSGQDKGEQDKSGDKQSGKQPSGEQDKSGQQSSGDEKSGGEPSDGQADDPDQSSQKTDSGDNDTPDQAGENDAAQDGEDGGEGEVQQQVARSGMRPEDVERLLGSLSRGEAATMREALRRAMGPRSGNPRKQVERDW